MKNILPRLVLSAILFLFWLLLTASTKISETALGVAVSLCCAWISFGLLEEEFKQISITFGQFGRLIVYFPFLVKEIVKANIDVAERVLRPDLPISPMIVRFHFPLDGAAAKVTMANSITLTPGTLTLDIDEEGQFTVHCLAEAHAESLIEGKLRRQVIRVYQGMEK